MANIERGDYWRWINRAADDVKETVAQRVKDGDDLDESLSDEIAGWCESGSIYTYDALTVIAETSDGDDAALDVMGSTLFDGVESTGMSTLYSRVAYYAIEHDLRERLGDWTPDQPESEA